MLIFVESCIIMANGYDFLGFSKAAVVEFAVHYTCDCLCNVLIYMKIQFSFGKNTTLCRLATITHLKI